MGSLAGIQKEFPILSRKINGNRLVYLDNAATTQKPKRVIDALVNFYTKHNANVHRGIHTLSNEASEMYEQAHERAAQFINAAGLEEIVFTRNTTESVNLVSNAWGRKFLGKGDVVVLTEVEHHSNIVPWQMLVREKGIVLEWIKVDDEGQLDLKSYEEILKKNGSRVKLVSLAHISNVLGTVNPVQKVIEMAHESGALAMVDSAQAAARQKIDVKQLDVDLLAFSSHKMYGPDGIGVLYGKKALLEQMNPWMCGGGMIKRVTQEEFECDVPPWKFEAGTPNISDGVAFAEAINFLEDLGMDDVIKHERELMTYAMKKFRALKGVKVLGSGRSPDRLGVVSFAVDGVHPHDLASLVNEKGVAIRAGHHCAMPLHIKYKIPASSRISFGVYNTEEDIDAAVDAVEWARAAFAKV